MGPRGAGEEGKGRTGRAWESRGQGEAEARRLRLFSGLNTKQESGDGMPDIWAGGPVDVRFGTESWGSGLFLGQAQRALARSWHVSGPT